MTTEAAVRAEDTFRRAVRLHQQSCLDDAQALYRQTLEFNPRHFHALHLLGVIALQKNQAELAVELIGSALAIEPRELSALVNYGTAQHQAGRLHDAVLTYETAIELAPDCAEAFYNRGNALRELERHAAAVASYDTAIARKPGYLEAHLNRGLALSSLGQPEAAIASYERAIAAQPSHADAHFNLGNELRGLGRFEGAVASYDRAILFQPGFADAHLNRGSALVGMRRYPAALVAYAAAIALRPRHAESHFNRAGALQYLGDYAAAVSSYDTAIGIQPNYADAHANRGHALRELRRYEEAIASYDKAVALAHDSAALRADRRHIKMQVCDWRDLETDIAAIEASLATAAPSPNPFYLLTLSDSAPLQRRAAEKWVAGECPPGAAHTPLPKRGRSQRLHIGYFSADYHEHATAYLIAQLFELHDRSRFRITAFSFGPHSQGPMRRRLSAACDEFLDVRDRSDAEAAQLARDRHVDIAVDLKGFTQNNRAGIFSRRAAPIQVNYLGFPGTMGAPYMDYLIADHTLIPRASRRHYAEKIVYLPHSYQVNDTARAIAEKAFTRGELGLPPAAFVFCCFNNSYKILPVTFDRWMRILARVPDSVLWLLGDNEAQIANLRRAAMERRIEPRRLVFCARIDLPEHLARHRAADLFIDTLPCNAHTTASDALWAGLPVLTCPGEALAGRVAASLLVAMGLPELIASTLDRYEELAVQLATDRPRLADIRHRLAANRSSAPLFDTRRYAGHIETAFNEMYERYQADLPPEDIVVVDHDHTGRGSQPPSLEENTHHG